MSIATNPNVKLLKATRDAYLTNQVMPDSNALLLHDLALIIKQHDPQVVTECSDVEMADHGYMYNMTFRFDEDCTVNACMYVVAGGDIGQFGKVLLIEDEMVEFSTWLWETKNGLDTPQLW